MAGEELIVKARSWRRRYVLYVLQLKTLGLSPEYPSCLAAGRRVTRFRARRVPQSSVNDRPSLFVFRSLRGLAKPLFTLTHTQIRTHPHANPLQSLYHACSMLPAAWPWAVPSARRLAFPQEHPVVGARTCDGVYDVCGEIKHRGCCVASQCSAVRRCCNACGGRFRSTVREVGRSVSFS